MVDSADRQRMQDCQRELQSLLVEEVCPRLPPAARLDTRHKCKDLLGHLGREWVRSLTGPQAETWMHISAFTDFATETRSHCCRGCRKARAKLREAVKLAQEPNLVVWVQEDT